MFSKSLVRSWTMRLLVGVALVLFAVPGSVLSADSLEPQHKVVIHVSSDDPATQRMALANAVNLQQHYGMDNIAIEVVAYGPGLGLLTTKSEQADRIKSLVMQDIRFSACGNTIDQITKSTGHKPQLSEGVQIVPAGVARIIELQEQGYAYVRP